MQHKNEQNIFLLIARHAEAKSKSFSVGRPLSDRGVVEAKLLGENLKKDNFKYKNILHSGILRSEQTAEIIHQEVHAKNLMINQKLSQAFSENAGYWLTFIESLQSTTLIVGHNPTVLKFFKLQTQTFRLNSPLEAAFALKKPKRT